jgi:hypothetical protein
MKCGSQNATRAWRGIVEPNAKDNQIIVSIPTECHLWNKKVLTRDDLRTSLELVKTYEDDSHLMKSLLRCKDCGHLYFHEFYEIVDWEQGNDAQYSTWIPVDDAASSDALNDLSPLELLQYGGIRVDFPSNAAQPTAPYWNLPDPGQPL